MNENIQSALFDFPSLIVVILLFICLTTHCRMLWPSIFNTSPSNGGKDQHGGGLVGCELEGGSARGAIFLNALQLHSLTANLGDTRSIATHPASTTHSKLSSDEQLAVGITPGFIRFSLGLENIDDIIADVDQALQKSK